MPPPIGKIGGGLARAWELANSTYAEALPRLSKIGNLFQELAEKPGYFATSKELPARMTDNQAAAFLAKKHGVDMRAYDDPYAWVEATAEPGGIGRDNSALMHRLKESTAGTRKDTARLVRDKKLNYGTELYDIDTMALDAGKGEAKKLYPALYEFILSRPDGANIVNSTLSPNNAWRRSANMAPMLEKYGKEAGDRLLIDDYQLRGLEEGLNGSSNMQAYHRLPVEGQIGLLNAIGAARTGSVVDASAANVIKRMEDGSWLSLNPDKEGALRGLYKESLDLGLGRGQWWDPTTDVDEGYFTKLADFIAGSAKLTGNAQAVGKDSLRRAALTNDALNRGLLADDLRGQEYLTERLGRRAGGSVPGRTPGALRQTCACAGR